MANNIKEAVKNYRFLTQIEEFKERRKEDTELIETIDLLLEALAQESTGMYTSGFHCMEYALENAHSYIKERND